MNREGATPVYAYRVLFLALVALAAALVASADAQTVLFTLNTPNPQAYGHFGLSVAVGDVNGDGKGDIAVGANGEYVDGNQAQGRAYVFSGAGGSVLFTLNTPNPQADAYFGWSVAVGDVNGDGKADVAVGAYSEDVSGNSDQGRAYVFSGANGSLLSTLTTPNPEGGVAFGRSVAMGDVNGDGKGEIAVGADGHGRAYVLSGTLGSVLLTLNSPNPQAYAHFGRSVAVGDVNGDGKGDITVGAYNEDVGGNVEQGRAYVFSPLSSVGGIAELPDAAQGDSSTRDFVALAGLVAVALVSLIAGAWYARRRWGR